MGEDKALVREAAVEAVAELQLAAFSAGRGSTRSDRGPPSMDDWRSLAVAALTTPAPVEERAKVAADDQVGPITSFLSRYAGLEGAREAWAALDALTDATNAGQVEAWQSIDTAPKDGTPFDAWVPDAFGGRRMTNLSFNRRGQLRKHGLISAAELPRWPTHWMPLPSPPVAKGEAS